MGSNVSKQPNPADAAAVTAAPKGNPICDACNQRVPEPPVPALNDCRDLYEAVDTCMKQHLGRVAPCAEQWDAFRECHLQQKEKETIIATTNDDDEGE